MMERGLESNSTTIASSNIGFQLLKKCGWTEGTGLGATEQGRLEPLEAHVKNNKRGLGAEKIKKRTLPLSEDPASCNDNGHSESRKKEKTLSKRVRKTLAREKLFQEREFEIAFRREFWPENV